MTAASKTTDHDHNQRSSKPYRQCLKPARQHPILRQPRDGPIAQHRTVGGTQNDHGWQLRGGHYARRSTPTLSLRDRDARNCDERGASAASGARATAPLSIRVVRRWYDRSRDALCRAPASRPAVVRALPAPRHNTPAGLRSETPFVTCRPPCCSIGSSPKQSRHCEPAETERGRAGRAGSARH